ncbi:MAG TPA: LCP family protein [Solirubrobacteraceae bacterium]|nr:LCP family protein [Solirubrobacteraceae bacterium]
MAPPEDPEEPEERPEYRVYRSRKQLFPRRGGSDRDEFRRLRSDSAQPPPSEPDRRRSLPALALRRRRGGPRKPISGWRIVRWVLLAVIAWTALSVLVFLVSAQIQQGKVSDANEHLGGAGYPLTSPNNILVLGSDVRTAQTAEPGAQTTGNGRSDSILLLRVGGGANSRMSIARDTVVDIPGAGRQKINAAYAIGGTSLAVQTVERFTGIDIHHVMIVSFEDFPQLIDAMGGITYRGGCVVSRINGGYSNGGVTLRLKAGKTHIDGKQALALARTRKNACNPDEDDLTRARRQQKIVGAMKRRLLSPMAFVRLPLVSWNVPKAMRSDMSGPTLLGVFGALAFAGTPQTAVLGSLSGQVPESVKQQKVRRFLAG